MALEVLSVEYTSPTEDAGTEHSTVYATRVTGDFWEDRDGNRTDLAFGNAWRVSEYGMVLYPEEVDAYIELFQKIKALNAWDAA
jgi:hypothetical protein